MLFDARAAKLLKPGEHMILDSHPGLRLVCTASRRTWIYRYKSPVTGLMRQRKIGAWPAMSAAAAIAEWEKLRAARDEGREIAAEKRSNRAPLSATRSATIVPEQAPYSVRQICDDYLVGHIERYRKLKGANEVRRMFDTMLGPIGHLQPEEVTRARAFDFLNIYSAIPVQASKLRTELGAAWDYAYDSGRLADSVPNWWRQIMRGRLRSAGKRIEGKTVGTAKRVLTPNETGELLRWLPNFSETISDVLTLYLWTGTRGGEIMAIEGQEVSEEEDGLWWTIPKSKTKNAKRPGATDLRVPLIGRAKAIVERRRAQFGDGFLFPSTATGHIEQKVVQSGVYMRQPYAKTLPKMKRTRLPVTHWAPHDLRRTARTMLAALGCPRDIAESIIGHMLPGVEGVYNLHSYDAERRAWLTRLSDRLEELAAAS
jgi:integrase